MLPEFSVDEFRAAVLMRETISKASCKSWYIFALPTNANAPSDKNLSHAI
jgi:hypothetical protein